MERRNPGMTTIPQGYKSTELGIIPETWSVKELGQILSIHHGKSQKDVEADDGEYPIMATGGQIGRSRSYLYNKPSVLIGRKGTIDKPQFIDTPFWTVDTLFYTSIRPDYDPFFTYSACCCIDWESYNEGTCVPSLISSTIEKIKLPIPSDITEQRSIAAALADVDALIEAKRALLEKKRAIKQGTMQELLTGKRRLPGFPVTPMKNTELGDIPEDWEVRELGSLVDIRSAKRVLQSQWNSDGIPFYRTREIIVLAEQGSVENELYISQELYKRNFCICPAPTEGDIMLTAVGTIGKTYLVREGDCFYYKDASVLCLRNQRKIVPGYLNLQLSYVTVQNQISGDSDGTTVKTITINKVKKYLIPVPSSTLEQERIHEVIKDQDNEIRSLQKELSKLSCIKQGMMQNLLTGRIRLV
ncbi:MAG: restriction endonuclease subunit S [Akkermansia sp.]|nr:restriction endonuclease subunit S [Akkermansia sp.]